MEIGMWMEISSQLAFEDPSMKKYIALIIKLAQSTAPEKLPAEISAEMAPNCKFCPVTSVDVERPFSSLQVCCRKPGKI